MTASKEIIEVPAPTEFAGVPTVVKVVSAFILGAVVGGVSVVQIMPRGGPASAQGVISQGVGPDIASEDTGPATDGATGATGSQGRFVTQGGGGGRAATGAAAAGAAGAQAAGAAAGCAAGQNGGATDQGVTGDSINMATTVVDSGIGAAFLRDVRFAMDAGKNKINSGGGVCGRRLNIRYVDDGWDPSRGAQFLRNFINEPDPPKKIFAIPVGPSSEGLRVVIDSGDITKAKIPVVGTDGMLIDQYVDAQGNAQPWVWPVAAPTVAAARIIVTDSYKRNPNTKFSIVFDKNYRFGVEGAEAFNSEVKRITGQNVSGYNSQYNCQASFCGVVAGQPSYSGEVASFQPGDTVALFLEPQTALTWLADPNVGQGKGARLQGAQSLFTRDFAVNCQAACDQMTVWTGFKPFIESHQADGGVREYAAAIKATNPNADEYNAFAEGGYLGMLLLWEALKAVGPNLTRDNLKAALDAMSFQTSLVFTGGIAYSPSNRYANTRMQGFVIQYKGSFGGWREGPVVGDPRPSAGIG